MRWKIEVGSVQAGQRRRAIRRKSSMLTTREDATDVMLGSQFSTRFLSSLHTIGRASSSDSHGGAHEIRWLVMVRARTQAL